MLRASAASIRIEVTQFGPFLPFPSRPSAAVQFPGTGHSPRMRKRIVAEFKQRETYLWLVASSVAEGARSIFRLDAGYAV